MRNGVDALRFVGVSRTFPGVRALHDVSFAIASGSVHALCGENGAGKSTLGKILAGIHAPDAGHIEVFGEAVRFGSPREALARGIGMVHQELSFCENLSVAENLCLGALPARRFFVDRAAMRARARDMLASIESPIDVEATVGALPLGQRQMVQIAAAVGAGARVIVFDEPTSSLSQGEAERLYLLIDRLRERGVTSIYVSHRMDEIFRLCDAVTVLRDGRHVATQAVSASDEAGLVQMMIGRAIETMDAAPHRASSTDEALRVSGLSSPGKFSDISFVLRRGEVLGLAGLVGAGRSEIAQALFGLDPLAMGEIQVAGRRVDLRTPRQAMALGLGLVPEDRKRQGLVLDMSAESNSTLPVLERLSRATFIRRDEERALAASFFERLRVRAPGPDARAAGLSGGNQQKLVLAKWLAAEAKILILDEPTRGVDVGAKAEIHALVEKLARDGSAILLISSELPELLRLSTRILVVRAGRLAGEVSRESATQDGLLRLMAGLAA
ncbi:MAG: sugar ABC transporter ATP-binding protein [Vicinamibacteria bacterium]|nr:sugar ABC transporter ATP-binding protein [Vicinamibacteria bacterium]